MNNAYEPAYDRLQDELSDRPEDDGPPEYWQGKTGKWFITYWPPPIPDRQFDWHFRHDDYDGPEDGRCGDAASWADCVSQIEEMEAEMDQ